MKVKLSKVFEGIHIFFVKVLVYLCLAIFSLLAVLNFLISSYFDKTYAEWTLFRIDNVFIFLVLFVITIFLFLVIDHRYPIGKFNTKKLVCILMIFTFIFSLTWIKITHSEPVADRLFVSMIASEFIKGDYSAFNVGHYLYQYPYQLGIVAFIELVYRVVGGGYYQVIELLNAIAVCVIFYSIYRITKLVFGGKVSRFVLILLFGCFCAMFFCTYVYGNLFGLAFTSIALWMELAFLETSKSKYIVISIICISIGIILKNNYSIVLIAMVAILVINFFRKKKALFVIFAVLMLTCSICSTSALNSYYSIRGNVTINEGIPMVAFIAMGLQDGWFGKGTYNKYTVKTYEAAKYDEEKTAEISTEKIKEQMTYYFKNPVKGIGFFSEKIVLQWTEPTYMSIWESNCADNHTQELSEFTQSMYVGFWHNLFVGFMNFYQSFIWICAAFYIIVKRKILNANQMLLGMIIIGGFIFHIMWEAKSQYVIQYFIFAIPYAAAGFEEILNRSKAYIQKRYKKSGLEAYKYK